MIVLLSFFVWLVPLVLGQTEDYGSVHLSSRDRVCLTFIKQTDNGFSFLGFYRFVELVHF